METTEASPQKGGCRPPLVMLPYTEGVSDDIRRVCRKFGMKVDFRSRQSLHSMLTKVKDALSMVKMSKGGVSGPLQLQQGLCWGDSQET